MSLIELSWTAKKDRWIKDQNIKILIGALTQSTIQSQELAGHFLISTISEKDWSFLCHLFVELKKSLKYS